MRRSASMSEGLTLRNTCAKLKQVVRKNTHLQYYICLEQILGASKGEMVTACN